MVSEPWTIGKQLPTRTNTLRVASTLPSTYHVYHIKQLQRSGFSLNQSTFLKQVKFTFLFVNDLTYQNASKCLFVTPVHLQ